MPGPAQPATSTVGALLRLIEQEKSKAPHLQTPQAAPSAPAREMAQAPLESPILPESPGSERTVGVKAETLPATTEAGVAADVVPGRSVIGERGGPLDLAGMAPGATPGDMGSMGPQTPKPTLGEYRAKGKTAAQWYAETGRQSTLDAIGKDVNKSVDLVTGKPSIVGGPRSGKAVVGPEGNVGFQPEAPHAPNNASLQDYLSQGKTREQWYAETGQQSSLDKLGGPGNLKPLPAPRQNAPVTPTPTLGQNLMPSSVQAPTQGTSDPGSANNYGVMTPEQIRGQLPPVESPNFGIELKKFLEQHPEFGDSNQINLEPTEIDKKIAEDKKITDYLEKFSQIKQGPNPTPPPFVYDKVNGKIIRNPN